MGGLVVGFIIFPQFFAQFFSRAYAGKDYFDIAPWFQAGKANEILGSQLNTIHNLSYYLQLMEEVRESLAKDRFSAYREEFHRNRQRGVEPGQD